MSAHSSQICEHCLASCDDCLSVCFFVYVCSFFCQAFSNLLSMGLCDMCVVSSVARHTTRLLRSVFLSICVPHCCTIAKDGILQLWPHRCTTFCQRWDFPVVSPLMQYCQRWDSLVVDPQLLHYCQRWDFGGCVTHIAELLPKMGFSGLSPWLHSERQRWDSLVVFHIAALLPKMGFFSFVHIEALLPKMMGYSDYVHIVA